MQAGILCMPATISISPRKPNRLCQYLIKIGSILGSFPPHPQTPLTGAYRATTGHPRACFQ